MKRRGFTLLELLIAIAIFAGLMVVMIAVFFRAAASTARVDRVRDKAQAARLLIDKISSDFRFVDFSIDVFDAQAPGKKYRGFYLTRINDQYKLVMHLKHPDSTRTRQEYEIVPVGSNNTAKISLRNRRGCTVTSANPANPDAVYSMSCEPEVQRADTLLPTGYYLDYSPTGRPPFRATAAAPDKVAALNMKLTVKADESKKCQLAPAGTCFTAETTVTAAGGVL